MQYFFTKFLASTERATTFAFRMKSLAITPYQIFGGILFIMALCFASSCQIIVLSGAARYAINEFSEKGNSFVVCSQLIERKKIDGILEKFAMYLNQYNSTCQLFIIGEGELKEKLQRMAQTLGIAPNVIFTGKMTHDELLPILSKSKALLVNTVKDNNMISIVEAIAVGTPIVTTYVPLNSTYIKDYQLGIAKKQWDESDLNDVVSNSEMYIENCMKYRYKLSTKQRVEQFLEIERERLDDGKK